MRTKFYTCDFCSYKSKTRLCEMCNRKGFGRFKNMTFEKIYRLCSSEKLKDWVIKCNHDIWGTYERYIRAINGEKYRPPKPTRVYRVSFISKYKVKLRLVRTHW